MKRVYNFCAGFFSLLVIIYATEHRKSGCLEKEKALTLLQTAEDLLTKAGDAFPSCRENITTTDPSECGDKKPLAYIEISKKLISEVRQYFPTCPIEKTKKDDDEEKKKDDKEEKKKDDKDEIKKDDKENKKKDIIEDKKKVGEPSDCSEILASGKNDSGVYTIWLGEGNATRNPLEVYCDMETDEGGWTMIQRRGEFPIQEDFYRDWESYKNGFGNITQEFWLGNENIRVLCLGGCKIRFDLQDEDGEKRYQVYKNFTLSAGNYRLHITDSEGNAGDGMMSYDGQKFSTTDKGSYIEKANMYKGGWWYGSSIASNLNGVYKPGKIGLDSVYWFSFRKSENLASVEIKVMPN